MWLKCACFPWQYWCLLPYIIGHTAEKGMPFVYFLLFLNVCKRFLFFYFFVSFKDEWIWLLNLLALFALYLVLYAIKKWNVKLTLVLSRMANALSSCNSATGTGDIISTTERLKQELEVTMQRQEIVSCFLRDYQLSNEEVLAHF